MPNLRGTTNKQTLFLRAFRTHESGPPPEMWPSPSILRKRLRKPAFITALRSVQEALRFQTDFHQRPQGSRQKTLRSGLSPHHPGLEQNSSVTPTSASASPPSNMRNHQPTPITKKKPIPSTTPTAAKTATAAAATPSGSMTRKPSKKPPAAAAKSGNDHRFEPILMACKHLLPNKGEDYLPHFASQRRKESAADGTTQATTTNESLQDSHQRL